MPPVDRMFVDSKHVGAIQALALLGFALGKLRVDAPYGRRRYPQALGKNRGAYPVSVMFIDFLPPRLGRAPAGPDPRQRLHEAPGTLQAHVTPAADHQFAWITEARQMARPPLIPALAVEAAASTARAMPRRFQRLNENPHQDV